MKTTTIYEHKTLVFNIRNNKVRPCLLFVTTEMLPNLDGIRAIKITVNGKANPFPFKEAIITDLKVNLDEWLLKHDYVRIGHQYTA